MEKIDQEYLAELVQQVEVIGGKCMLQCLRM